MDNNPWENLINQIKIDEKYVKLEDVQELLNLIEIRDMFFDWSNNFEEYDKKVKAKIEWIEKNAININKN